MNRQLIFTESARSDFVDIQAYTIEHFGIGGWEKYEEQMAHSFDQILTFPESGIKKDEWPKNLRGKLSGRHIIIYKIDVLSITVVRIFHQRMDFTRQFSGDD